MTSLNTEGPDEMLDTGDPGDDVNRRFRYQAAYAALMSLGMLMEPSDVSEVFCEHHEDVLVKHTDATFTGIQVKTRKGGQEPFKATDLQIHKAILRFIEKDTKYPSRFRRFLLVSNCDFWSVMKNKHHLPYLLSLVLSDSTTDGSSHPLLKAWVKKLSTDAERSTSEVMSLLRKTVLKPWVSLDDYELKLVWVLSSFESHAGCTQTQLTQAVRRLIDVATRAASLAHASPCQEYFSLAQEPAKLMADLVISGKCITKDTVEQIIAIDDEPLLATATGADLSRLPNGVRNLELKMAGGEIRVGNISLAKDHKHSMETLLNKWLHKDGLEKTGVRYGHLRTLVNTECQEAYDAAFSDKTSFGTQMLSDVRDRLRRRYQQEEQQLFRISYEHLLGVAGILTEECTVWWSIPFDIPKE